MGSASYSELGRPTWLSVPGPRVRRYRPPPKARLASVRLDVKFPLLVRGPGSCWSRRELLGYRCRSFPRWRPPSRGKAEGPLGSGRLNRSSVCRGARLQSGSRSRILESVSSPSLCCVCSPSFILRQLSVTFLCPPLPSICPPWPRLCTPSAFLVRLPDAPPTPQLIGPQHATRSSPSPLPGSEQEVKSLSQTNLRAFHTDLSSCYLLGLVAQLLPHLCRL